MDEVTTKTPKVSGPYEQLLNPHISRFRLGAMLGGGVRYNAKGCDAMARLLKKLATDLDAVNARIEAAENTMERMQGNLPREVTVWQKLADFFMGGPARG